MSFTSRRRQPKEPTAASDDLFAKLEHELAEGYLEVEITGITPSRLLCVYAILLRGAWSYTLGSVRSLLRVTPAH